MAIITNSHGIHAATGNDLTTPDTRQPIGRASGIGHRASAGHFTLGQGRSALWL